MRIEFEIDCKTPMDLDLKSDRRRPCHYTEIVRTAAEGGYHAIGLGYSDKPGSQGPWEKRLLWCCVPGHNIAP